MDYIVEVPKKYENIANSDIKKACDLSLGGKYDYKIKKTKIDGRYILLYYKGIKKYICFSNTEIGGRNSFLAQYLGTAYTSYILDSHKNKKIEVYFLIPKIAGTIANYHYFINRVAKTLDIKLLNENVFNKPIKPFLEYQDYADNREKLRGHNKGNYSSYFIEEKRDIYFYGKVFGANGKESVLLCHALEKLTDKKIIFFPVEDNDQNKISNKDNNALEKVGIKINENITRISFRRTEFREGDIRDRALFQYNLLKKYGPKKCYLCDCDIEPAIIGAHIHRVTDIKRSDKTEKGKIKQAVDGDNGLWLCSMHDRLFEIGLIYFKERRLIINNHLKEKQKQYIESITKNKEFYSSDYSNSTKEYLKIHFNRIGDLYSS